jgi:hypothetical protein
MCGWVSRTSRLRNRHGSVDQGQQRYRRDDAISPTLIKAAEGLRTVAPELFEKTLIHGIRTSGPEFIPANATEFVKALNNTVQRDMAQT